MTLNAQQANKVVEKNDLNRKAPHAVDIFDPTAKIAPSKQHFQALPPVTLTPGVWTALGPQPIANGQITGSGPVSGRMTGIATDPVDAKTIYVSTAGGGVWKTTDAGVTWTPLTDKEKSLSMGAIAISPSRPQVVWAATGEATFGADNNWGTGILVSPDGGSRWLLRNPGGIFDRSAFSEIAVDPTNPALAYAADASGLAANSYFANDGIWKTTDYGATWTNTTSTVSPYPWTAVRIDLTTPSTLYGAVGFIFGTATNGVYKSTDSGATWALLAGAPSGLPAGNIKLAVAKSASKTLYVVASGNGNAGSVAFGNLYQFVRSTDGGATFTDLTANVPAFISGQGWYDLVVTVDPSNAAIVYLSGQANANSIIRSTDSGVTWTDVSGTSQALGTHPDHHASAFDANGKFLDGDDGGIFRLEDPIAVTWTDLNAGLNTIQFQGVSFNRADPTIIIGGSQDNGTERSTGTTSWTLTAGGDGGPARFSNQNTARAYHTFPLASAGPTQFFNRSDDTGLTWTPKVTGITDVSSSSQNFYAPYEVDPSNGDRVLFGGTSLWETTNAGDTWVAVGAPFPTTIDSVGLSAGHPENIYVSAGGKFYFTPDKGVTWTPRSLPVTGKVSSIKVAWKDPLRVVVSLNIFPPAGGGNVYISKDAGVTWRDISTNLPRVPVNSVFFHGDSLKTIYVGEDEGVYKTTDEGQTWLRFGSGLPNVQVLDLDLDSSAKILAAGTHGRGAWELMLPPSTTTTTSAVTGTSGSVVTFTATVGPLNVPGKVIFEVDRKAIPGTSTYDPATGIATQSYTITQAPGSYLITADFISSNETLGGNSGGVSKLTVQ